MKIPNIILIILAVSATCLIIAGISVGLWQSYVFQDCDDDFTNLESIELSYAPGDETGARSLVIQFHGDGCLYTKIYRSYEDGWSSLIFDTAKHDDYSFLYAEKYWMGEHYNPFQDSYIEVSPGETKTTTT